MVRARGPTQTGTYLDPRLCQPARMMLLTPWGSDGGPYRRRPSSSDPAPCDGANQSFSISTTLQKNSAAITLNSAAVALFHVSLRKAKAGLRLLPQVTGTQHHTSHSTVVRER